jgi:hypothetical protein
MATPTTVFTTNETCLKMLHDAVEILREVALARTADIILPDSVQSISELSWAAAFLSRITSDALEEAARREALDYTSRSSSSSSHDASPKSAHALPLNPSLLLFSHSFPGMTTPSENSSFAGDGSLSEPNSPLLSSPLLLQTLGRITPQRRLNN